MAPGFTVYTRSSRYTTANLQGGPECDYIVSTMAARRRARSVAAMHALFVTYAQSAPESELAGFCSHFAK